MTSTPHTGRLALALVSLAVVLTGCSSSSKPSVDSAAGFPTGSDVAGGAAPATSAGGGDDATAAAIKVCSLLTPADAQQIGTSTKLSDLPNVTYKLMTEKPTSTASSASCTLTIYNELPDGTSGNEAIVTVEIEPAKYRETIDVTKMPNGPGDAAYDIGDGANYDQVISRDYLLESVSSQGASRELIDDMYRAMIPNLKKALPAS